MKTLKNCIEDYINENYLYESAWDIEDNIDSDNKELLLDSVKKFIKDNYINIKLKSCEFIFDEKKDKYVVNYDQQVTLKPIAKQLTNGLFEWGEVDWNFNCSDCPELTSLEGAPTDVSGAFDCYNCPKLTSLQGAPNDVGGAFDCSECPKLTTLEGAPAYVGGGFFCFECPKLESLKGAPEEVEGNFNCSKCPKLKSLKGAPKYVGNDFKCDECPNLHSLDGIGKVDGFIISDLD